MLAGKTRLNQAFADFRHRLLGVRRFLRRGMDKVRTEWSLVCTAVNIGILLRHWKEVAAVL